MSAEQNLGLIYQNIGVLTGIGAAIAGAILNFVKQHFNHSKNTDRLDAITKYLNEAHDTIVANHDKFVSLVNAATGISPELKAALEANGADVSKILTDSGIAKDKLQAILDEVNGLTGQGPLPAKK